MGRFYTEAGRFEDAETQLLRAYQTRTEMGDTALARPVAESLAELYTAWERPAEAAEWAKLLAPDE